MAQRNLDQLHWHIWQCSLLCGMLSPACIASEIVFQPDAYCATMQYCYHKAVQHIILSSNWVTLQIQTSVQHAVMMVNPYPRCADSNELLELLALRQNEKSVEALMNSADMDDLQHIANWETVIQYAASLDASNVHEHVPFLKTPTL